MAAEGLPGEGHGDVPAMEVALHLVSTDPVEALDQLDSLCETDQGMAQFVECGGIQVVWPLLEEEGDVKREAMGLLFSVGYRKGMGLDELVAKNQTISFEGSLLESARRIFERTFCDAQYELGKKISMAELDRKGDGVGVFAYGEAELESFAHVLSHADPQPGEVFCDLGSGLGKAIVAAFLLNRFSKMTGIELLEDLSNEADRLVDRFKNTVIKEIDDGENVASRDPSVIQLIQGDFLQEDWSDADVVYANATRYDEDLMMEISKRAERLKSGSRVITTTSPLVSSEFSLKKRGKSAVRWMGNVPQTFFVFVRN